jgi:hypothetical protein
MITTINIVLAIVVLAVGFMLGYLLGVKNGLNDLKIAADYFISEIKKMADDADASECLAPTCKRRITPDGVIENARGKVRQNRENILIHEGNALYTPFEKLERNLKDSICYHCHSRSICSERASDKTVCEAFMLPPEKRVKQSNKEAAESVSEPKIHPRYREVKDAAERSIGVDTQDTTESTE